MRYKIASLLILFTIVLTAAQNESVEYQHIRLQSIGVKTEIPAEWLLADTALTSITYTNPQGDAHYIFNVKYESGYTGYEGYNKFTEEMKADMFETGPNTLRESRPEFSFEILKKEFTDIGDKEVYHIQHRALLKPEFRNNEEYANYPGMFCEDMYIYLNWGYFYSYQIYRESEISDSEIQIAKHIIEKLELF